MRILLAEDHTELREAIARRLRALGNSVDEVSSLREIRTYLNGAHYDVGVFDRMLPDGDSLTLLQALRNAANRTPILLLTARDRIEDRVEGLQVGADDYLVKPFAMDELLARINVLARRGEPLRDTILRIADLEVDSGRHEVRRAGVLIPLRPKNTPCWNCWQYATAAPCRVTTSSNIAGIRWKAPPPTLKKPSLPRCGASWANLP
nr:response regulator [Thiothrix subterranea]